ncbi:hypothetical protein LTR86_008078 [Recurvomyces mirabilis]|nr:hypothetical protein LTR86_008078 [Recurvomyces mirabilis]
MSIRYQRHQRLGLDTIEDVDEYRLGGYHLVHLGDVYHDRYKVLHKLGAGGFATTWLARDHREERYVALKILKAEEAASEREMRVLEYLSTLKSGCVGGEHIRFPLNHFTIKGPNGDHNCLVSEVAGPSLSSIYNIYGAGFTAGARRLRGDIAKKAIRQLAEAVGFLHSNRFCHGDLTLPNVLLKFKGTDGWTEEDVYERLGKPSTTALIPVTQSESNNSGPDYVVEPAGIPGANDLAEDIVLVDFGEAFSFDHPPKAEDIGIPLMYRAPETIFDGRYDSRSEIWALACVMYEIRAGDPLFTSLMGTKDEIIMQWVQMKGRMPDPWWGRWERRARCFEEDGRPRKVGPNGRVLAVETSLEEKIGWIGTEDEGEALLAAPGPELLEPYGAVVPDGQAEIMRDLLDGMLKWRPEERVTIEQVLKHPWVAGP